MPGAESTYPAGETPPPYVTIGPPKFRDQINGWLGYLLAMSNLAADASVVIAAGTSATPGRIRATGTGGSGGTAIPTFTVVDASAKDKLGAHPGRVRVYAGYLGGLRPAEMPIPDAILPNGTDNHCYLTMSSGDNYITGKVLIDPDSGFPGPASIYRADSPDEADGTYVYWPIAYVSFGQDGNFEIEQINTGNTTLFAYSSADGNLLQGEFNPVT